MTAAITIVESATLSASSGVIAIGDVLIPDALTGEFVKATTANRGSRRAHGVALTAWGATVRGAVRLQTGGVISAAVSGLGAGTATWVRTSTAGTLERCTPASGDDLLGKCDESGNLFLDPGVWDSANSSGGGGGGGTTPSGTGFRHVTSGVEDGAAAAVDLATADVTGILAEAKGGTGFSAFGAGVATFLQNPTSANLIAAITNETGTGSLVFHNSPTLTTPRINNTGGTFQYIWAVSALAANRSITLPLLTGNDTFAFEAHAQTLTNKTINGSNNTITNVSLTTGVTGTLPVANGGTGVTALTAFTSLIDSTSRIGARSFFTDETTDATAGAATVNDYAIGDYGQLLVLASAGTISYTGFAAPAAGECRDLVIIGAQAGNGFKLLHDNAGSVAANRIYVNSGLSGVLAYAARLRYSPGQSRWVLVSYTV